MLAATIVFYSLLFPSLGWTMLTADTYLECQGQFNNIIHLLIFTFYPDIPVEILTWSTLFSEYSAAATCAANFNSQGSKVICDPGVCPSLEQIDTTIITGFMGYDHNNQI
jgi:hypothetical protein